MRIACVSQDRGIAPGARKGAAVHVLALRAALRELGHDVCEFDESDPARLRVALEREAAARPFDFVYERCALGADAASRFAAAARIPHVLELNAPLEFEERVYRERTVSADVQRREVEVLRSAAAVLCVSTQVAAYARERGARASAVHVLPNAVDTRVFRPRAADDALRARLVPEGRVALGFHGRLRPWHAFELVVRAGAALLSAGLPLHLVLVGEGEFEAACAGRIPRERITRVDWQPYPGIARTVACFDLLALGSFAAQPYYYSPLKLREAMACGVVPVVPRLGDLPQLVADGRDGACYEPGSAEDLARVLEPLVRDGARRTALATAACASAGRTSWHDVAQRTLDLLGAGIGSR